ncbi:MAG: WD40 repeat domain-containing protein, partial [Candidatus Poribacteria bacterium]|nr:WD40 repeat domain-containing protein [Candidatus Poribacteria bacterium]
MNAKTRYIPLIIAAISIIMSQPAHSSDFSARVWKTLKGYAGYVWDVEFSPNGNYFAVTIGGGTVELYDRNFRRMWRGQGGTLGSEGRAAFSPDEKYVALSAYGESKKDVTILRLSDRRVIQTLTGHAHHVSSVSFSPDGSHLASGSKDRTIRIWKLSDGQFSELQTLKGDSAISCISFSPDGRYLASGRDDSRVKVWKLSDGRFSELQTLRGHTRWLLDVTFSPDGNHLATLSWDNTIRIWKRSGDEFLDPQTLIAHGKVMNLSFSPDGKYLAGGSWENTIAIWALLGG